MLLRKGATETTFTYPYYELNSNFREDWSVAPRSNAPKAQGRTTMSVSAVVEGFETEGGDILVAYSNGEECGSTILNSQLSIVNYLSIAGDAPGSIWFAIERDGEIVATTGEMMTFKTNAVIGSPDEPTAISFIRTGHEDGKWYTIGGMQLQKKPTQKGIYIFNGKKVMVK